MSRKFNREYGDSPHVYTGYTIAMAGARKLGDIVPLSIYSSTRHIYSVKEVPQ